MLATALVVPLTIFAPLAPAAAATDCTVPVTVDIRGNDVILDQCYDLDFTHGGTDYAIHVYYRETPDPANTGEHELADVDNADGDNLNVVSIANESRDAVKFHMDQDLNWPPAGETDFNVWIGEDPRSGGIDDETTIYIDDERADSGDPLWHRILAYHEFHHTTQLVNDGSVGWRGAYGEGISRAIEDRVDTALDALTAGYFFIPEVQGVLATDGDRTADLLTKSYETVLWWTWLMDQYRTGGEVDPVTGWDAIEDFYAELAVAPDQASAIYNFISGQSSSFEADWIDYTLALFAYDRNPSDPRLGFLDPEITANGGNLSGHDVLTGGPAFATSSEAINARSSHYVEFTPANQCEFVAFEFESDGPDFGFSVMTVDAGGTLADRWSSQSDSYIRTVSTNSLSSVVGVISGLKQGGTVEWGKGCVEPTIDIKSPTNGAPAMVGAADNPEIFLARLDVDGKDGSPVGGLTADDFDVSLTPSGGGSAIAADVISSAYVQDDYWLAVQAPDDGDGAATGQFYNLTVELGSASDSNNQSVLYVDQDEDVVVVLDRSGSMGGATGKLEAAQNAAELLFTNLADDDQGGYVSFNHNAVPEVDLGPLGSGQRGALEGAITGAGAGGDTSIGDGMFEAQDMEENLGDPDHVCSLVLLSDGHENSPALWADVADDVRDNECPLHVIALGPGAHEPLLQEIGSQPAGSTYDYAQSAGSVPIGGDSGAGASGGLSGGGAGAAPGGAISWENNLSRIYDYKAIELQGRQRLLGAVGIGDSSCTGRSAIVAFEDQPDRSFEVGQSFVSNGQVIDVDVFDFGNGQFETGVLRTLDSDVGIGDGQRAFPQNAVARLGDLEACRVSVEAAEFGGLKNVAINGDLAVVEDLGDLDGAGLGGAEITYQPETGVLTATGEISEFVIGGQEFAVDNIRIQEFGEYHEFVVDKTSDVLQVAVAWQRDVGGAQKIELIRPDGTSASPVVRQAARGTSEVAEVKAPQPGLWRVGIDQLEQEYYVSASANTQLELNLFTGTPLDGPAGTRVPILGMLTSPAGPIVGADVVAMVTPPDSAPQRVVLFDDGNHDDGEAGDGVYGNWYTATNRGDITVEGGEVSDGFEPDVTGSYQVDAVATFDDHRREAQGSFALRAAPDSDQDGQPDGWERDNGLDPGNPQDFWDDDDFDDLINGCEFWHGTDPQNSDTDGGGEADGSEIRDGTDAGVIPPVSAVPEICGVQIRNPFDPDDDPGGPVVSIVAAPEAHDDHVHMRIEWSAPQVGEQIATELWRRTPGGGWTLVAERPALSVSHIDETVVIGQRYQYLVRTTAKTSAGAILTNVVRTAFVEVVEDPDPPVGDVLIDGGALVTNSRNVTLTIDADDTTGHSHGDEPAGSLGTPRDQLEMRISSSVVFSGPWRPFATEVPWDLGPLSLGDVASVFVQFRDQAGNVSQRGLGWTDSIVFGEVLNPVPGADGPVEVAHVVSCLAGNGRVDTNIVNTGDQAANYRIEFQGLSPRAFDVASGDWWRMPITGRPDGDYDVVVKRDSVVVSDTTLTVSCDTAPPELDEPEIQVVNACRAGNGYLLFQFVNATASAQPLVINFQGVPNRSTTAGPYAQSVRAVTGRPDGVYAVTVTTNGAVVETFDVSVDCDP